MEVHQNQRRGWVPFIPTFQVPPRLRPPTSSTIRLYFLWGSFKNFLVWGHSSMPQYTPNNINITM